MSSARYFWCEYCRKRVENLINSLYGKLSPEKWEELKNAKYWGDFLDLLPDDEEEKLIMTDDVDRIIGVPFRDFNIVEDWGGGIYITEDGKLLIDIACSCDLCGKHFSFKIIAPQSNDTKQEFIINDQKIKINKK